MKQLVKMLAIAMFALTILPAAVQAQYEVAQSQEEQSAQLFHGMYTGGATSQSTAGMYPAPLPTPRVAGHVFYTYQPLQPHQMMYEHTRTYYTPYGTPDQFYRDPCNGDPNCGAANGGAYNKTTVTWQHGGTFATPYPFSMYPMENLRRVTSRFGGKLPRIGGGGAACTNCN